MEFFDNFLSLFKTIQFRDIIDILAIAFIIFGLFRLVRETRAVQLLKGVLVLFIVYFFSSLFGLVMLSSLLRAFFEASVVLIAIIFQPEIRKALEQMGRKNTWGRLISAFKQGKGDEWEKKVRKSIVDAADTAEEAVEDAAETVDAAADTAEEAVEDAAETVTDAAEDTAEAVEDAAETAADAAEDAANN